MTKDALIKLFDKEKIRVQQQIVNPIINSIKDNKYTDFYNHYIIFKMNKLIRDANIPISLLSFNDSDNINNNFSSNSSYEIIYNAVMDDFFEICNFDMFKIIFGYNDEQWKPWATSFLKYVIYCFYNKKNLTNVIQEYAKGTLDESKYTSDFDFKLISDSIYKTLYGFNKTLIFTYEYWERTTKISKKFYNSFEEIVEKNNPSIYLLNSFLYFNKNLKKQLFGETLNHKFRSYKPIQQVAITNPEAAYEYISNYFTCLILTEKIQISLWKAIQNLTFGTKTSFGLAKSKTITNISLAIKSVWALDDKGFTFFKNLKYQSFLNHQLPPTFEEYIHQSHNDLIKELETDLAKYESLKKILL